MSEILTIVERLRMIIGAQFTPTEAALVTEAADTIEALLARVERLAAFEAICLEFKRRVEAGEVRSQKTYAAINAALSHTVEVSSDK